ncbi:MAG TPA: TetR/AcrR family transcriptional regulator [Actinoplanes sp.]|nr:TetR/AcrR family transcriptional regulator [Actinoplanes sp.]
MTATRKHISADVRREQLTAAALRVMKRDGIAAATTRAICTEAGMAQSTFHYCFRSKQELYTALLSTDINVTLDAGNWPSVDPTAGAADNVRLLLRAYWSAVESDATTHLVLSELVNLAQREPELSGLPAWQHQAYLDKATALTERFAAEAGLVLTIGTRQFAELVVAALNGVGSAWLSHRDNRTALETLDNFATLLAGLTEPLPAADA